MEAIKAGMRNEMVKFLNLKKYLILLLLACVVSIAVGLLGRFAKGLIGISTANMPLTVLSIVTTFILPLIISMAAADLFTAEQENGSIKAVLTRPVSRISIFSSKILSIFLYIGLFLMICLVSSLIYGIFFNSIVITDIAKIFLAYILSLVPALPVIFFAVTVSQLCKSTSTTVMLSVFGYLLIVGASILFPGIYPVVFTSYIGWYKLFIGAVMPFSNILNIFVLLTAYSLILFAISSWLFEKREY